MLVGFCPLLSFPEEVRQDERKAERQDGRKGKGKERRKIEEKFSLIELKL